METNSSIRDSYKTTDKIYLGSPNLKRPLLFPFVFSLVILTVGNVILLNQYGVTLFTLAITSASFIMLLFSALMFRKLMAQAYLKHDNFVVKYLKNKQAKVMCVYRIFGYYISLITYKLDGVKQKALVFGSTSEDQNPKELILQAKSVAA
jgi:hypothetical protein